MRGGSAALIPLDYETPRPPERNTGLSPATGRYLTGLLIGLIVESCIEGNAGPLVCGGIYSLLPMAIFYFTTFVRRFFPFALLEERSIWLTLVTGAMTALIESEILNWSDHAAVEDGTQLELATLVLLPMISSFVSMRRR